MLKFIFWSLLAMNGALYAYGQGWLGNVKTGEREPGRLARQLNTDKLQLLVPGAARATPPAPAPALVAVPAAVSADAPPASPVTAAPAAAAPLACIQVGNFAALEARRFERLLAPLELLPAQLSQEEVQSQEITSYMVMIPPLGSKEAADKKAAELKEQGVSNYFILGESSPTKWAISLGVFKSEAAARTLLAALLKQGVTGAKIAGRSSGTTRTRFTLRNLDAAAKKQLDEVAARFATVETLACK